MSKLWIQKIKIKKPYLHSEGWVFKRGDIIERILSNQHYKKCLKAGLFDESYVDESVPYNHINIRKIPKENIKKLKKNNPKKFSLKSAIK